MKERPILFSGPMVRAILDGKKTQTRRVCKVDVIQVPDGMNEDDFDLSARLKFLALTKCPYGQPGDRLWVRETWADNPSWDVSSTLIPNEPRVVFKADFPQGSPDGTHDTLEPWGTWKPSIYMPRWASRLTLEIVSVRVERLKSIKADDAYWEGVEECDIKGHDDCFYGTHGYICSFERLWDSINAKKHPWQSNPWVWVVEFKAVQK